MIRPCLSDMINDHKIRREWKIQLTIPFSFTSSKDSDEIRNLHIKSNNTEIMIDNETDGIIEKLLGLIYKSIKKI